MRTRISVFLITLSGLILEVGLTRIYSASIWYHFAFVAISVALLGWGLGGFTVHLLKQRVRLSMDAAALVTLLYAGAIPLCLWLLARFPFEMERLPLYFLAPLLPFFLAGWRCRLCSIFSGRWRGRCTLRIFWGQRLV